MVSGFLTEKPLSLNVAEGEEMVAAVEKAGVPNMVWYNYRRIPSVTLAKNIIDRGSLGRYFIIELISSDWTIHLTYHKVEKVCKRLKMQMLGSGVTGTC